MQPVTCKAGKRAGGRASARITGFLSIAFAAAIACAHADATSQARLLDGFDDISGWSVDASDQVRIQLRQADGAEGSAMCMDYDFNGVSGYAFARRKLLLEFPDNYAFDLKIRGDGPANNLEIKLLDATGENVWWHTRRDFIPPSDWQTLQIRKRHIDFAWGPAKDRQLRQSAVLELVISRGKGGGRGSICFDHLRFRELAATPAGLPVPTLIASGAVEVRALAQTPEGHVKLDWDSRRSGARAQQVEIDFKQAREFGGLVLHWRAGAHASHYDVQFSDDRKQWTTVRTVRDGNGGDDPLYLPESETRYLRVLLVDGPGDFYGLAQLDIRDIAFGASQNAFFQALAREQARGRYPRGFSGEQSYWTIVGVDGGGGNAGLISEDGAIEAGHAGFSVEPLLLIGERLVTWADVTSSQSLQDEYLPIPSVHWVDKADHEIRLDVTTFAMGGKTQSQMLARYVLRNDGKKPRTVRLALAARPFQVNPPAQFLGTPGGVHPIHRLAWAGDALLVDGEPRLFPLRAPDAVVASTFDAGMITDQLDARRGHFANDLHDPFGFASAALIYQFTLAPRSRETVDIVMPLHGKVSLPGNAGQASQWVLRQQQAVGAAWRAKLNRVALTVPKTAGNVAQTVVNTVRTSLAHLLMSRNGAALQPGIRSYARSWIRDGAMMADGLLRLGNTQETSDFAEWFAPFQFANGKVPCCVDARGADPVPENDSHGELIFMIAQLHRYGGNRAQLEKLWPHVEAAADYMESLRQSERTPQNQTAQRMALYGLMPASISHEGYSAKPMHSHWDNFWALKGYKDAAELAEILGKDKLAGEYRTHGEEFRRDIIASINLTAEQHRIDYIPGAAELVDFDATSTTIALSPADERAHLPRHLLDNTFERYWREFLVRRDVKRDWDDYTPYEVRTIGSFVRLGWRDRAQELIKFFLADRRPHAWNGWAEVVGRDMRKTRFIGDMPHAWISSDFIRGALDLFAYEREADRSLVLAAGVPAEWLGGTGVAIRDLRTPYGNLSYRLGFRPSPEATRLHLNIAAGLKLPAGGLVFDWPWPGVPPVARINGRVTQWEGRTLRIVALPADVVFDASR